MKSEDNDLPEAIFAWLEGDDSSAVEAAVTTWLSADEDRREGLEAFARVWRSARAPRAPSDWDELAARIDRADGRAGRADIDRADRPYWREARRPVWRQALQVAAVLVVGVGLGVLGSWLHGVISPDRVTRVVVPAGSQAEVELPGGVRARVNAASELAYASSRAVQDVHLDGEAFFTVPGTVDHDFFVHTEAGVVRDLGTEFNVRARSGRTTVAVTSGHVELESTRGVVALAAGQVSAVAVGELPEPPDSERLDQAMGWLSGRLVYADGALGDIAAELGRRYGLSIRVAEALRDQRLAVSIDAQTEAGEAVRLLCQAAGARCRQIAGTWFVQVKE